MIRRIAPFAAIAFSCVMIWCGVIRPVMLAKTKREANLAMQNVARDYGSAASRRLARETLEQLEPFLKSPDRDAELLVLAAACAYSVGDLKRSEKLYAGAAAIEGRPEILTYLGAVQAQMGLPDRAVNSFGRAVAFAPAFINREEISTLRVEVDARANAIRAGRD